MEVKYDLRYTPYNKNNSNFDLNVFKTPNIFEEIKKFEPGMITQFIRRKFKNLIDRNQDDRTLIIVIIVFLLITGLIFMTFTGSGQFSIRPILIVFTIIEVITLLLAYWGILQPAKIIVSVAGFIVVTVFISIGGIHDDSIGGYYILLILTTLLFGRRGLLILGTLNTIAIVTVGLMEVNGVLTTHFGPLTELSTVFTSAFFMIAASLTLYFFVTRLTKMVEMARRNEQFQIEANRELSELKTILEQRVEDRTSELQTTNKKLKLKLTQINKLQAKLVEEAIRDPLTGLYNRRFMNENLNLEIARAKRLNFPIAIFFLDIDHFKKFNDRYGHQVGDSILKEIGKILQSGKRAGDIACRYGGEEFLIVLPGMPKDKAKMSAERIKAQIKAIKIPSLNERVKVTISIGVAVFPQDATLMDELIFEADQALYFAKLKGRDRVELVN